MPDASDLAPLRPAIIAAVVHDAMAYAVEQAEQRARTAEAQLAQVRAALSEDVVHGR